jgi:hypothetical protein
VQTKDIDDHRIGRKGANLHRNEILPHAAATDAIVVEDRFQKIPELVFGDLALDFPTANLIVERIEQLLSGRRTGERRPLEERAAEAALIAKTLWRSIEGNAQPIHQVDDLGRPVGHLLDGRLML